MISVFLDTDVLIPLFNKSDIQLPGGVEYYTFDKNIYEYKYGLKKYLIDGVFIIQNLKNRRNRLKAHDLMQAKAHNIIQCAFNVIPTSDLDSLLKALKTYDLKYHLSVSGENIYQEDDEYFSLARKYCKDYDINAPMHQLYFFYRNIYREMVKCFREIDDMILKNNIKRLIYQQIFTNDTKGYELQQFIDDACVPPKDLEIVLASLRINCNLFLSCDEQLIKSCLSLGLNHLVTFVLCKNTSLIEDICTAIHDYREVYI